MRCRGAATNLPSFPQEDDQRGFSMPPRSPSRRSFTLLAAAAVAAPWVRAQGKPEKTKLQIAVDGKTAFNYLPLTIAEQLGYFQKEGLDVDISDFAGGPK